MTQLLTEMDGVKKPGNVLVIAMTNRRDILDVALLRPGRFEVQLEIPLPDETGRLSILKIHCAKAHGSGHMSEATWASLPEVAHAACHFTGAELAGAVRLAGSFALRRVCNKDDFSVRKDTALEITTHDLLQAVEATPAQFGAADDSAIVAASAPHGIQFFDDTVGSLLRSIQQCCRRVQEGKRLHALRVLVYGPPGCGLSALAAAGMTSSAFHFQRYISSGGLKAMSDKEREVRIVQAF